MEWNGVSQAASLQFGPWSNWVTKGTLRAVSEKSYRRNLHCRALLHRCLQDFHGTLVRYIIFLDTYALDTVIVSIDMEGLGEFDQDILSPTSIGVATLDTRTIFDPSTPFRNNGRYLFSEREIFTKHTALDVLKKALTHQGRDVILLSHSTENELDFMARMGFKPEEHARITNILDTGLIASGISNGEKHAVTRVEKALQHVLQELGFAGKELHNAANDADFTLRALMLLILRAVQDARADWTNHTPFRVLMLREIASTPLPPTARSGRSPRRENMRPETAEANRAKKQARRKAGAEWEQEFGSF